MPGTGPIPFNSGPWQTAHRTVFPAPPVVASVSPFFRLPGGTYAMNPARDRKSTRLNSSHPSISYAVFCLKKKSRERSGINTILHELNPLFTINVTMRDIKSKNVYSRVNSKATTQWRKTESANGVHLEGVASDNRFFFNDTATTEIYTLSLHDALPI